VGKIAIEQRGAREVTHVTGRTGAGRLEEVLIAAPGSAAVNYAFDVTPARLISAIVTERGVSAPADLATHFGRTP
jgi:methylthioribose-1-phosphate isomerase